MIDQNQIFHWEVDFLVLAYSCHKLWAFKVLFIFKPELPLSGNLVDLFFFKWKLWLSSNCTKSFMDPTGPLQCFFNFWSWGNKISTINFHVWPENLCVMQINDAPKIALSYHTKPILSIVHKIVHNCALTIPHKVLGPIQCYGCLFSLEWPTY